MEAFSDGVMAVAITLLALNLNPHAHWLVYVTYVLSFFTVGVIWVNHHALFNLLTRVDRTLLFVNLTLLLFVVAIPFATDTLAQYLFASGRDAKVAAVLYSGIAEGMSICFTLIFAYAHRAGHMIVPLTDQEFRKAITGFGAGCLFYLVAMVVGLFSPVAMLVIASAITMYYIFQRTPTADADLAEDAADV